MADPVLGLSLASLYPCIDPLLSMDKHDKSGVYLLKETWRKSKGGQIKKLCKINTELADPAPLLLFLG